MVEYIDQKIHDLAWQIAAKTADITDSDCCGDNIISGSDSSISIWQFVDTPSAYDQLPITEATSERIPQPACRTHLLGNIAFTALINGTVLLHELATDDGNRKQLQLISETKDLHPGYRCNDMLFCPQTNSVLTCGNDGAIGCFNIENPKKSTKHVSESSLKCMDILTPNEIICGTLTGSLKHFDLRSYSCIGTFANQNLSTLVCLQRNPNVNHLAVGGNDQGSIIIYDLRNQNSALAQISAHGAAITSVKYRPKEPNILYSSSVDGELFRWNLSSEFSALSMPKKVECIGSTIEPLTISSFDINHLGDMLYSTDHGAIFYRKLNEIGI